MKHSLLFPFLLPSTSRGTLGSRSPQTLQQAASSTSTTHHNLFNFFSQRFQPSAANQLLPSHPQTDATAGDDAAGPQRRRSGECRPTVVVAAHNQQIRTRRPDLSSVRPAPSTDGRLLAPWRNLQRGIESKQTRMTARGAYVRMSVGASGGRPRHIFKRAVRVHPHAASLGLGLVRVFSSIDLRDRLAGKLGGDRRRPHSHLNSIKAASKQILCSR